MSLVTNIILSFSIDEDSYESDEGDDIYALMVPINAWLTEHRYGAFGRDADHISGGNKHLETPLYVAAFNLFSLNEFVDMLRTLPWHEPRSVQVFVQEQEEDKFRLIEPFAHKSGLGENEA
jgi:hypothetical protein